MTHVIKGQERLVPLNNDPLVDYRNVSKGSSP